MIRMLLFFVKLAVLVWFLVWVYQNQGVMHVNWQGYIVEANTSLILIVLILAFVLYGAVYHVWRRFVSIPKAMRDYRQEKLRAKGYDSISKGFLALASGDAKLSLYYASQAEKILPETALSLLLKAQSANLNGDAVTTREIFSKLLESKDGAFFGIRGLLSQAIKMGNSSEALALLRKAYKMEPKRPWVVYLLLEMEAYLGNWTQSHEMVAKAYKLGVLDKDGARQWHSALYLAQAEKAWNKQDKKLYRTMTEKACKACPEFAPTAVAYARTLVHFGKKKAAIKYLAKTWRKTPHAIILQEIVTLIPAEKAIPEIEAFTKDHPHNLERLIILGHVAIEGKFWGLARSYLTSAIERGADKRAYVLMSRLASQSGEGEQQEKSWLNKGKNAPSTPCWICSSTGSCHKDWTPYSTHAWGGFNTLEWATPDRVHGAYISNLAKKDDNFPTPPEYLSGEWVR